MRLQNDRIDGVGVADAPLESLESRWIGAIEAVVRGKRPVVRRALLCLLARGHVLLEDVPGVGKTTLAQALARTIDGEFRRIQFTSDLLPGDLTGASLPEPGENGLPTTFRFRPGPLFGHLVLADEINRASPKTQSALLEAMSEGTVSIDGTPHPLPDPCFVIATQNPIEHSGTHPLPESQLDRFTMRLSLGHPAPEDELAVLRDDPARRALPAVRPVVSLDALRELQRRVAEVKVEAALLEYLLAIVTATRNDEALSLGASTRAALALRGVAQASALLDGRDYCIPDDVRDHASDVLAHRVVVQGRGAALAAPDEARWVLDEIVARTAIPL